MMILPTPRRSTRPSRNSRRTACALSSAAIVTAFLGAGHVGAAVNSFFPGVSFANADFTDPTNWTLGTPNDPTQDLVIPTGGQVNGAVTMVFNGGSVVGATLTHSGTSGRVLVNNSGTPATLTLAGAAGKPTILNNNNSFQLTIGTDTINQLNLQLVATDNIFQNNAANVLRIFANIKETTPGTNVTINAPRDSGTFSVILGGNNTFTGALNIKAAGNVSVNFTGGNALGQGSVILNGGTLTALASQGATATNSVLNQTTFNAGTTQFIFQGLNQIAGGGSTLNFGALSRNVGAAANLQTVVGNSTGVTLKTTSTPVNGILGGWLTIQPTLTNNFSYDWATTDGSGNIVAFTNYQTKNDLTTWSADDNININGIPSGSVPSVAINSLRTDAPGTFTMTFGGATTINSGGILIQGNSGGSSITFDGAGPITSGTTDLIFTLAGSVNPGPKLLTVSTPIVDRDATHPLSITKNHTGTLIILGSHTYSGDIYINQGSLNIDTMANKGSPSGLGTNGTIYLGSESTAGTINYGVGGATAIANGDTSDRDFVFNDGGANIRNQAGTISFTGAMTGTGAFTRFGTTGTTLIIGSKTYSGQLTVGAGTLDVDVIGNIGDPSGLGTGSGVATIIMGSSGNGAALNYSGLVDASTNRPFSFSANNNQILKVENGATPVSLTLTGAMSSSFSWQKLGSGTLVISGSKTYSGTLTIGRGDLSIDTVGGLGTGAANSGNAATITLGNTNTATLTFTGASGTTDRPFNLNPQAAQFGGIEVTSGQLNLTGVINTNGKALAVDGGGTLNISNAILGTAASSITKNGTGTLILTGPNAYTPVTSGIAFTNITKGRIVMDYTGNTSPGATVGSLLQTSYASGFSTGQIRSTTADAHKGLGWADDGSHVTVAYTYFGDANLDGAVTTSDFVTMSNNFGSITGNWAQGDFNYDGKINALDFNAISTNFGSPAITTPTLESVVPEPGMVGLFLSAAALGIRRRKKG